ncbi:MAG: hypothetical protein ABI995_02625 [Acidobacteriota bacterium]
MVVPIGGGKPFPAIVAPGNQNVGRFSPDGKWIAYNSGESGSFEIYIQPFVEPGSSKGPGGRWQVSNAGGANVVWRKDGREIYYDSPEGNIMAALVEPEGSGLKIGAPRFLLKAGVDQNAVHTFDTLDGQKFVVQLPSAGNAGNQSLTVVANWRSALRK